METTSILSLTGVVSAFVGAALCVPPACEALRRRVLTSRSQAKSIEGSSILGKLIRNGISWSKPLARLVLSVPHARAMFSEAVEVVRAKGYETTTNNLCSTGCASLVLVTCVGWVVGASPIFGLAAAICCGVVFIMMVNHDRDIRRQRLSEEVPDAIRSMSVCFHAGFSLLQTFQQIATESREPLKTHFMRGAHALETGSTAEDALGLLRQGTSVPELAFVAVALEVQHSTGGSMQQVLDTARDSIENGIELKRSLKVQTAQARLSAQVVTAMPFVLMALFSLITEDFLAPFFSSAAGLALLLLAIVMQVAGVLIVRSLLKAEGQ